MTLQIFHIHTDNTYKYCNLIKIFVMKKDIIMFTFNTMQKAILHYLHNF